MCPLGCCATGLDATPGSWPPPCPDRDFAFTLGGGQDTLVMPDPVPQQTNGQVRPEMLLNRPHPVQGSSIARYPSWQRACPLRMRRSSSRNYTSRVYGAGRSRAQRASASGRGPVPAVSRQPQADSRCNSDGARPTATGSWTGNCLMLTFVMGWPPTLPCATHHPTDGFPANGPAAADQA